MEIIISPYVSKDTLDQYIESNNIDRNEENHEIIFQKLLKKKYIQSENKFEHKKYLNFDQLEIGNVINVWYCTDSQKFMDYDEYRQFTGILFYKNNETGDALFYYDHYDIESNKWIKTITNLLRPGCSYFGDSQGYTISLCLIC